MIEVDYAKIVRLLDDAIVQLDGAPEEDRDAMSIREMIEEARLESARKSKGLE
jgi:hypothetical protein